MLKLFLLQMLKTLWRARVDHFWPIWITITVVAAIFVVRVVGRAASPMVLETSRASVTRTTRHVWSRDAVAALALLGLFLVCDVALSLRWEDFTYSDNSMFTLNTLRGHDLAPTISRASGRFYPLGEQEFNLIRHFTGTVAGYHALPIAELLILSGILLILDDELNITARVVLTIFALLIPSIVISFTGLIYEERNVLLCLACLVLFVKRFDLTHSTAWAVAAVVCAQIMIYYKETAFLVLLGFAAGRLLLRCWDDSQSRWDFNRIRRKENRLDVCLASLAVLFLLYYTAVMIPRLNIQYAHEHRLPLMNILSAYIKVDLLAWLFVAVVLGRMYLILRHRVKPLPLWDGLALGGVACFIAYLQLRIQSAYYLAPVDLIAVLYVGRFAILVWDQANLRIKVAALILLFVVLFQDVSLSAFRMYERKNVIHGKAEVASAIKAHYQANTKSEQRVYFPFTSPYRVMEFASYLSYRGLPVEGAPADFTGLSNVVLVTRAAAKDGRCVDYESLVCHTGSAPDTGDLVVVLPDDDASFAEITPYRDGGELLFSYEPSPRIPQWLHPFFSRLHVISYAFAQKELPDRWLNASVTAWE